MSAVIKLDSDRLAAAAPAYEEISEERATEAAKQCGLPIMVRDVVNRSTVGRFLAQHTFGEMLTQSYILGQGQMEIVQQLKKRIKKKDTTIEEIKIAADTINQTVRAWSDGVAQTAFKSSEVAGVGAQTATHERNAPRIEAGQAFIGNNNTFVSGPSKEPSVVIETNGKGNGKGG